jgi:hypothetical protein
MDTENLVLLSRGKNVLNQNSPLLGSTSSQGSSSPVAEDPLLGRPLMANLGWNYTACLGITLASFIFYLIIPKGFRFQYCRSLKRRHAKSSMRRKDIQTWINAASAAKHKAGESSAAGTRTNLSNAMQKRRLLVQGVLDTRSEETSQTNRNKSSPSDRQASPLTDMGRPILQRFSPSPRKHTNLTSDSPSGYRSMMSYDNESSLAMGGNDKYTSNGRISVETASLDQGTTATPNSWNFATPADAPPSPKHPAIPKTPTDEIVQETMGRLLGRGIRLIAHGVQCEPKRVWIRLDGETTSVTWQTEFPRRVPTLNGDVSIVLMRGSLHKIALPNVLYIDVGKKTTALKKVQNKNILDAHCLSLLTQNGSLDLQTNSLLERDSIVACFSLVLDQIHTQDWRKLYEESPSTSQATASTFTSGIRSDLVEV